MTYWSWKSISNGSLPTLITGSTFFHRDCIGGIRSAVMEITMHQPFTANWSHALRSCSSRGSIQPRKPKRAGSICVWWRQTPYNRSTDIYAQPTFFPPHPSPSLSPVSSGGFRGRLGRDASRWLSRASLARRGSEKPNLKTHTDNWG